MVVEAPIIPGLVWPGITADERRLFLERTLRAIGRLPRSWERARKALYDRGVLGSATLSSEAASSLLRFLVATGLVQRSNLPSGISYRATPSPHGVAAALLVLDKGAEEP